MYVEMNVTCFYVDGDEPTSHSYFVFFIYTTRPSVLFIKTYLSERNIIDESVIVIFTIYIYKSKITKCVYVYCYTHV